MVEDEAHDREGSSPGVGHVAGELGTCVRPVGHRRATVEVLRACNNTCVFCGQDGLGAAEREAPETSLAALRAAHDDVTFVGGVPTLDVRLAEKVGRAASLGFRNIGVQTNGSRMADPTYTASLARAGLTDVHVSLHGADAAVHDYHTGRPGSWGEVLAAVAAAKASGLVVVATTVLTRSNFRVLAAIPELLVSSGLSAWCVSVPSVAGRASALRDRVVPRLGLAIPFALQALARASSLGLPSFIVGAPLCLLGPFAARALSLASRSYAPVCDACPVRSACPGLDPVYLSRFEGDELFPRVAGVADDGPASLRAMFVGPGELAPVSDPPESSFTSATRARVSLPLLGKVKPAELEVSSGTAKRTGEALKEIFPTLFAAPAASPPGDDGSNL